MRRTSLVLSVAVMVMLLVLSGLAGAPNSVIPNAVAQYEATPQYGDASQYGATPQYATDGSAQSGVEPSSCEQNALNALSSPDLGSNSAKDNRKLLAQFVKCGGTIASLPQEIFGTLLRQGVIELDVVGSSFVACPSGDRSHCSTAPGA